MRLLLLLSTMLLSTIVLLLLSIILAPCKLLDALVGRHVMLVL